MNVIHGSTARGRVQSLVPSGTIALPLGEGGGKPTRFVSFVKLFRLLLTVSLAYSVDFRDWNGKAA